MWLRPGGPLAWGRRFCRGVASFACVVVMALASVLASAQPAPAPAGRAAEGGRPWAAAIGDPVIDWLFGVIELHEVRARRTDPAPFHRRILDAIAAHPQSMSQGEAQVASREAVDEAWAGYLPTISGSSDGGYRRVAPTFEGQRPLTRNGIGAGLQMRQTVYDFGATSNSVDAARHRLEATEARRSSVEMDLAMRGVVAHYDVMRARLLFGLAERNVADRTRIVSLLESRREIGGGAETDIRRATARLAAARSVLVAFENRLRSAEAAYREIFSVHPERLDLSRSPEGPASIEDALRLATERHPALVEARAVARSARSEAEAVTARALPNVGVEGAVSRREQLADGVPGTDASLLLVFRYNFYTGGADTARRNQALARARQAEQDERALGRQLDRLLRQAQAESENAARAIDARAIAVLAGVDALRANREQLELNRGSIVELLKSQEELFDAGRDLIDSVFDGVLSRYRLLQFAGTLVESLSGPPGASVRAR
ncbi:MAG: TolC family protein [Alphaproteobacteria bacterium]